MSEHPVTTAIKEVYGRLLLELAEGEPTPEEEEVMRQIISLIGKLWAMRSSREPVPTADELREEFGW